MRIGYRFLFLGFKQRNHRTDQYPYGKRQKNRNSNQNERENSTDNTNHQSDHKCPDMKLQMAFFPCSGDLISPDQRKDKANNPRNAENESCNIEQ